MRKRVLFDIFTDDGHDYGKREIYAEVRSDGKMNPLDILELQEEFESKIGNHCRLTGFQVNFQAMDWAEEQGGIKYHYDGHGEYEGYEVLDRENFGYVDISLDRKELDKAEDEVIEALMPDIEEVEQHIVKEGDSWVVYIDEQGNLTDEQGGYDSLDIWGEYQGTPEYLRKQIGEWKFDHVVSDEWNIEDRWED